MLVLSNIQLFANRYLLAVLEVYYEAKCSRNSSKKYGSKKDIEDMISIRLEDRIRRERNLLRDEPDDVEIEISVRSILFPVLNSLCIKRRTSKNEFINSLLKRL